jgi:hypothetical protein
MDLTALAQQTADKIALGVNVSLLPGERRLIEQSVLDALQTALQQKTWRCFHCDEVFTDEAEAKFHFGVRGDGDVEDVAACQLTREDVESIREMQAEVDEARADQRVANVDAEAYHQLSSELARLFDGARTGHGAWLKWEAMEGRALAAEERANDLLSKLEFVQNEKSQLRKQVAELQTALHQSVPKRETIAEVAVEHENAQSAAGTDSHSVVSPSPAPRISELVQDELRAIEQALTESDLDEPKQLTVYLTSLAHAAYELGRQESAEERESFRAGSLFLEAELAKAHACAKESADAHEQFFQLSNMEIAQLKQQVAKLRIEFEHKVEEIDRLNQILRSNDATIAKLTNERDAAKRLLDSAEKQIEAAQ